MSQTVNTSRRQEQPAALPLQVLRDNSTRCFVVTVAGKAWAQLPQESADAFYMRLLEEMRGQQLGEAEEMLATHRAEILAADDYVDPVLYEAGFFRDKADHDAVMRDVMTEFWQKQPRID